MKLMMLENCYRMMRSGEDMKLMMLENCYGMMRSGEMWGLEEGWKETDTLHGRFVRKY